MRLQTAPTGPGENIELPIYFLKLHETELTGRGSEAVIISKIDTYGSVENHTISVNLRKNNRCGPQTGRFGFLTAP